jgi:hypothetical protein
MRRRVMVPAQMFRRERDGFLQRSADLPCRKRVRALFFDAFDCRDIDRVTVVISFA